MYKQCYYILHVLQFLIIVFKKGHGDFLKMSIYHRVTIFIQNVHNISLVNE